MRTGLRCKQPKKAPGVSPRGGGRAVVFLLCGMLLLPALAPFPPLRESKATGAPSAIAIKGEQYGADLTELTLDGRKLTDKDIEPLQIYDELEVAVPV